MNHNARVERSAFEAGRRLAIQRRQTRITQIVEREIHQPDGTVLVERHITTEERS